MGGRVMVPMVEVAVVSTAKEATLVLARVETAMVKWAEGLGAGGQVGREKDESVRQCAC